MRRLWLLLPCALLLLVSACGPKPRYSGNVETGTVTDHGQPAPTSEGAAPAPSASAGGNGDRQKKAKFQELERQLAGNPDMVAFTKASWLTSRGNHYGEEGQLNEAIADFKEAIQLKPDHAPAHMYLAIAYGQKRMFEEALAVLNAAPRKTRMGGEEFGGMEFDRLMVMTRIYLLMGDKPRTLECAKKALQAANDPERREYIAAAGLVTQDDSETISLLQGLIRELQAN